MNNYNLESFETPFTEGYEQEQRDPVLANQSMLAEYESVNTPFTNHETYSPELSMLETLDQIGISGEYESRWPEPASIDVAENEKYDDSTEFEDVDLEATEDLYHSGDRESIQSLESEQPVLADVPPLIKDDTSVSGYTCYVNINIGKGNYPLTMTGIYIPSRFDPAMPVDVVLYMHGMTATFPGSKAQMDTYWTLTKLPHYDFRLREEVDKAGKNIVLVAPSLGASPNSYRNILSGKKGGLDSYMEQVQAAVNAYIIRQRFNAPDISFNKLILAGHSAGGSQILRMAIGHNPSFGPRIAECWGLDSLYSGRYVWLNWARKNPDKKLFIYYKSSTKLNSEALAKDAIRLSNVYITNSGARNHYLVPLKHFRERIEKIGSAELTKKNFEMESSTIDEEVRDWSKAITRNRYYGEQLGWRNYITAINDLLLPLSGYENVSLGEEAFAKALAVWQEQNGFSGKDADGILGPNTWRVMKPFIIKTQPALQPLPSSPSLSAQTEWDSSPMLKARYPNLTSYIKVRDEVSTWGIQNPGPYIAAALDEWNTNIRSHRHFGNNFDGDPHRSYLNLKRLYEQKGVPNAAAYFAANIISTTFFNRQTPAHRELALLLNNAQRTLQAGGLNYSFDSAWSFVPRTFNYRIDRLSNHALGRAIDINSGTNPHITSKDEILVIDRVCRAILPAGLLRESNPEILKMASDHFRQSYNDSWIAQQTESAVIRAIQKRKSQLKKYALHGFLDLPIPLIRALQNVGLSWGGAWTSAKDFMHFELKNA